MYVCLCKAVTDHQIRAAVAGGASSFGQLRRELDLAAQCGKCGILAREIFEEARMGSNNGAALYYAAC